MAEKLTPEEKEANERIKKQVEESERTLKNVRLAWIITFLFIFLVLAVLVWLAAFTPSALIPDHEVAQSELTQGKSITLRNWEEIDVTYNGVVYEIDILPPNNATESKVIVTLSGGSVGQEIGFGEEAALDVNLDGTNDFAVKLTKFEDGDPTVVIYSV